MNLLLHGVEYPEIDSGNALRFPLREIGDKDRVDVIVTNPPFGGEEERGILSNFPEDKQTAETALLFLQLIMRKLRRLVGGSKGGRCGMVVPTGLLFGDAVCARVKEELIKEFQSAHNCAIAERCLCPLHIHPYEFVVLRSVGADKRHLVLRAPAT
jgi:type I restriction enzyme M protein